MAVVEDLQIQGGELVLALAEAHLDHIFEEFIEEVLYNLEHLDLFGIGQFIFLVYYQNDFVLLLRRFNVQTSHLKVTLRKPLPNLVLRLLIDPE